MLEVGQAVRQARRHGKAARRQPLRRLDAFPEGKRAPPPHHLAQPAHLARDRDREPAALRERGRDVAVPDECAGRDRGGCALARVQRVHLLLLGDVDDRERAAADPGRLRVQDPQRERGRTCSIDGVAACLERRHPGGGRERVVRRDRGVRGPQRWRGSRRRRPCRGRRSVRARHGNRDRKNQTEAEGRARDL
jgi:hypothetical protein